jgi:PPP family 3-phenylpropionic acid transporter
LYERIKDWGAKADKPLCFTSAYYALIFMATAAFISYLPLFYAELGIGAAGIGMLTALSSLVGVAATPLWGTIGDRAKVKKRILYICLLATAAAVWLIPLSGSRFWLLAIVLCLFFSFQSAINPLSDTITLELAARHRFRFSVVRTGGVFGFAVMSVVAGSLIARSTTAMFLLYSLLTVAAWLCCSRLTEVEGRQRDRRIIPFWEVLRGRSLRRLYAYVLVLGTALGFYISFHAIYTVRQGISMEWLGLTITAGSLSQLPVTIYFDKLHARLGMNRLLLIAGMLHALRWLLYAFCLNPYTLLFLSLLHGGTFILVYMCIAHYVHEHIRAELKVSGQMMNFIVLNGAGRIIGALLGGAGAEYFGYGTVFAALGACSLAAAVVFGLSMRKRHNRILI